MSNRTINQLILDYKSTELYMSNWTINHLSSIFHLDYKSTELCMSNWTINQLGSAYQTGL